MFPMERVKSSLCALPKFPFFVTKVPIPMGLSLFLFFVLFLCYRVSRNAYDAFLYYLVNHNSGMSVDRDADALRKYVDEHNSKDK